MARILVLEDDCDQAALLRSHLRGAHHQVAIASTAQEALALVDSFDPDVALVDLIVKDAGITIPDGGATFIHTLRIKRGNTTLPIIVMSAMAALLTSTWLESYGVDAIYKKPIDMKEISASLVKYNDAASMAISEKP